MRQHWPSDDELATSSAARATARHMVVAAEEETEQWRDACRRIYALFPVATEVAVEPAMLYAFMIGIQCRLEKAER